MHQEGATVSGSPARACSGHGRCVDGRCVCWKPPYVGADCAYPACPENCSGLWHMRAWRSASAMRTSRREDCSEEALPGDCSGHGLCDTGECYCEEGHRPGLRPG